MVGSTHSANGVLPPLSIGHKVEGVAQWSVGENSLLGLEGPLREITKSLDFPLLGDGQPTIALISHSLEMTLHEERPL